VQVVLRASTSTSLLCSAVNRSLALRARNCTLVGSLKMAAASARQKSTSSPVQLPWASGRPKPASPVLLPQLRTPRALTLSSVVCWADAAVAAQQKPTAVRSVVTTRFMIDLPRALAVPLNCWHRIRDIRPPPAPAHGIRQGASCAPRFYPSPHDDLVSVRSHREVKGRDDGGMTRG